MEEETNDILDQQGKQEPPESETPENTEPIEGAEPSEPAEPAEPAKKENRVQHRIDELTREKYEARQEADRLRKENEELKAVKATPDSDFIPPGFPDEPTIDQFEDYEQYNRALVRWEAGRIIANEKYQDVQKQKQEQVKTVVNNYNSRVEAAKKTYTDWDDVIATAPDFVYPQSTVDTILESEQGADIQYYLANNAAEAERVHKLNPVQQIKEIAKLEAKFSKPDAPAKRVSQAPTPITPVTGNDSGIVDINKLEGDAWINAERARLAKLGRRY